jgi:antirestriction protein ArdC
MGCEPSEQEIESRTNQWAGRIPEEFERVVEDLLKLMKRGVAPWRVPWSAEMLPRNAVTRRRYSGSNVGWLILRQLSQDYPTSLWMTALQVEKVGGHLKDGESPAVIIYFGGGPYNPVVKCHEVYNLAQIDLPDGAISMPKPRVRASPTSKSLAAAFLINSQMKGTTVEYDQEDRAYYLPSQDAIHMPPRSLFPSDADFYATVFHELCHSTGIASRIGRYGMGDKRMTSEHSYSLEELVAEFGSCFLSLRAGLPIRRESSAAYLKFWASRIQNDPAALFYGVMEGSKAASSVLEIWEEPDLE